MLSKPPADTSALQQREDAVLVREQAHAHAQHVQDEAQHVLEQTQDEIADRSVQLRQANENLLLATLESARLTEEAVARGCKQQEFLAMLAHELRNPLAAIRGAGGLLARLQPGAAVPPLVSQVIERQSQHMARLLDDLLDASRITSGKVRLQRRPTSVAEFVDQAVQTFRALFDAQGQQFTVELPAEPLLVDGDPPRLAQIVGNLLHNAAKYTPAGGSVSLRVQAVAKEVEIRVVDTGEGIAADVLPHIFELFTQNTQSLSRSQGGLGIGLTVVRSMVEMHGGSVEAHSAGLGLGSEFIVRLPLLAPTAGTQPEAAATPPDTAHGDILLIDDNADALEVQAMLLGLEGHRVATAADGAQALLQFAQLRPDVVLCDIGLPGMSGYEVAQRMHALCKADATGGTVPLMVALTGYGGAEDRERSLAAGFHQHLVKPVEADALLQLIDAHLRVRAGA